MKYIVDKNNRPVYLQIYKQVRQDIIDGLSPFGTKLPSMRLLCDELSVSTVTVDHAYALLCDEGYIESKERSGYVVIFRKADGFAAAEKMQISKEEILHIANLANLTLEENEVENIDIDSNERYNRISFFVKG